MVICVTKTEACTPTRVEADIAAGKAAMMLRKPVPGYPARCPICGEQLRLLNTQCTECDTIHHEECWDYNRGCARYACLNGPADQDRPSTETVATETVTIEAGVSAVLPSVVASARNWNPWLVVLACVMVFGVLNECWDVCLRRNEQRTEVQRRDVPEWRRETLSGRQYRDVLLRQSPRWDRTVNLRRHSNSSERLLLVDDSKQDLHYLRLRCNEPGTAHLPENPILYRPRLQP